MEGIINIFGKEFEYDFLAGWIKYNRLKNNFSQEALAHGICSTSHLSYFENGKKKLRGDIIEALLKKLNISEIKEFGHIGLLRQKFYNMISQIESFNKEGAKTVYKELIKMEDLINTSPYNIEYKIYQLIYNIFVEGFKYCDLKEDILTLDKVYSSLSNELKYLYMFISGKAIYKYESHSKGIERLVTAYKIKETPWINYHLGFAYCFNNEQLKSTYYLEKALESYEKSGRYINALWCHNYLGICYTELKIYEKGENHFKAALTGAEHFDMHEIFSHLYINLSHLCHCLKNYEESLKWSELALSLKIDDYTMLAANNYADTCLKLDRIDDCIKIFDTYLIEEYQDSKYYPLLYFLYLCVYHLDDKIFYDKVTKEIIPFYESINYFNICKTIKFKLIEHLERKRKYKEANKIYKELI